MIYLGSLGRMIGIKCPASQRVDAESRYNFKRTIEGKRKAEIVPGGRRTWDVQTSDATSPAESATLQEFANGSWGRGPFWFLSADALTTNILPPITSVFGSFVDGGPLPLEGGGWAPIGMRLAGGGAGVIQFVASSQDPPVIPGRTVTASAYVLGSAAYVTVQFFTAAGTLLTSLSSAPVSAASVARRVSVSAEVPFNAATARVTARDATTAARPAVTWTDSVQPYGDGQGCPKAVVHAVTRDVRLTVPGATYLNLGFTVTEVG